jgi:hypothetical protein
MPRRPLALAAATLLLGITPIAGAHQRQLFQIGAADYLFVVGFLNEPVFTGDKSGLDLAVWVPGGRAGLDLDLQGLTRCSPSRKGLVGSFGCPESRSEAEFPPARR